ncbi:single-stranded-DNA-specific exonuclease RecJ [candidate division KSB1 bacterium]
MQKQWIYPAQADNGLDRRLGEELNIPPVIANILISRDIITREQAVQFFTPKITDLHDPYLMKNMDVAIDRIQEALKSKEKILIYGDYDVDGITACSLLYLYFKELTDQVHYFIPDRLKEGYGFSLRGVEEAQRLGVTLIITVDCAITANEEIAFAQEQGIDVIVTDHHEPGSTLPPAVAILNPMQPDCPYPFKGLAGVGVAFKLVQGMTLSIGWDTGHLVPYTDLVAIGSAADIVPLVDENRILVKEGINRINERKNIGLNALLDVASLHNCFIGTGQILFGIAPRINAVGRLGSAERAVSLFTTNDRIKVYEIARVLEEENKHRKSIEEKTFNEAFSIAEEEFDPAASDPLVLADEDWHPGVIGIVASRLVDRFYRPSVMIALDEGIGKGSIRSVPDFDVFSALQKCSGYLKEFGGHKYAAGLTIEQDKLQDFKEAFKQSVRDSITQDELVPKLKIDAQISLDQIDERFYTILRHFAPFGLRNTRPIFVAENVEIVGTPLVVGKNHLKFSVRQNGDVFPAIAFNMGERIDQLEAGRSGCNIAFVIDENTWRGSTTLQLQIKDLRQTLC